MVDSLGEKEEKIKRQAENLQDFDVYRNDYKRVQQRCGVCERYSRALARIAIKARGGQDDSNEMIEYLNIIAHLPEWHSTISHSCSQGRGAGCCTTSGRGGQKHPVRLCRGAKEEQGAGPRHH